MGVWDYHCAICAASIKGPRACKIGSSSETSLQRRRELIRENRKELGLGDDMGGDEDLEEIEKELGEEASGEEKDQGEGGEDKEEDGEEEDEEGDDDSDASSDASGYENITYDPELVDRDSLEWLEPPYCIGLNPDAPGPGRGFISGPGSHEEYGEFDASMGDDPNQPDEDQSLTSYGGETIDNLLVFPFHWQCLEILTRAITGSTDVSKLDKEILYGVMEGCSNGTSGLHLDYGDIEGNQQDWSSEAGEEYSVCDPSYVRGFDKVLRRKFQKSFLKPDPTEDTDLLNGKVINDPFNGLPYDVLYLILELLPVKSIQQLLIASWSANCAVHNDTFWKRIIHSELAWFWELRELVDDLPETENVDFKKVYFWLDKVTTPTLGMRGRFMGIANRRRIWRACQQLAESYFKSVSGSNSQKATEDSSET